MANDKGLRLLLLESGDQEARNSNLPSRPGLGGFSLLKSASV